MIHSETLTVAILMMSPSSISRKVMIGLLTVRVSPSSDPGPSSSTLSVKSVRLSPLDVGELVNISASSEWLEAAIHSLTNSERYRYPTDHFKPSRGYQFLSTYRISAIGHFNTIGSQSIRGWFTVPS